MRYNLESRVERLERQRPANPYEHLSYEELEARITALEEELSQGWGFSAKGLEIAELRQLIESDERGDSETVDVLLDQFRRKYGPPLARVSL
jgi:hypothetical protein